MIPFGQQPDERLGEYLVRNTARVRYHTLPGDQLFPLIGMSSNQQWELRKSLLAGNDLFEPTVYMFESMERLQNSGCSVRGLVEHSLQELAFAETPLRIMSLGEGWQEDYAAFIAKWSDYYDGCIDLLLKEVVLEQPCDERGETGGLQERVLFFAPEDHIGFLARLPHSDDDPITAHFYSLQSDIAAYRPPAPEATVVVCRNVSPFIPSQKLLDFVLDTLDAA